MSFTGDQEPLSGSSPYERQNRLSDKAQADFLREGEEKCQSRWHNDGIFLVGGPEVCIIQLDTNVVEVRGEKKDKSLKFYGTVPLLPTESRLHMGHAFTILQVDFAAGYAMMKGKRALFTLGFHCSGSSNTDRAARVKEELAAVHANAMSKMTEEEFRSRLPESWILHNQGIPGMQVQRFGKPAWWLAAFPELAKRELQTLGVRVDWRRSFVSGNCNPFFRSFVQWQVKRLRQLGRLQYGKAYTLWSLKDGEPCPEREDGNGERITMTTHTVLKMKVTSLSTSAAMLLDSLLPAHAVLQVACHISRIECLHGLGCCFVDPGMSYGVYAMSSSEYLVASPKAARNMAYQGIILEGENAVSIADLRGSDLVGTVVEISFPNYIIRTRLLPDVQPDTDQGIGIRAGLPMESLGDYLRLAILRQDVKTYEVKDDWLTRLPSPTIQTETGSILPPPELLQTIAYTGSKQDLLSSQKLKQVVHLADTEAYFHGRMLLGPEQGMLAKEARVLVRNRLLQLGHGFEYREPSFCRELGDDCVVAYKDHWHLSLGLDTDEGSAWLKEIRHLLNGRKLNHLPPETRTELQKMLWRLSSWAVGRRRGNNVEIPWEEDVLVDSFTEAAIAPAYQTISHMLHSDMLGDLLGTEVVRVEQMTDQVWDFVFSRLDITEHELGRIKTDISHSVLCKMRLEFEWWYPVNLFVVDKDEIHDHLAFFLCHHLALFIPKYWPSGVRIGDRVLQSGRPMNGRTGAMVPLGRMIDKYGADAVRLAVARMSSDEGLSDVEWNEDVLLDSMRRLYALKECIMTISEERHNRLETDQPTTRQAYSCINRKGKLAVWDLSLLDELQSISRKAGSCYERHRFREAAHHVLDVTRDAFDCYRQMTREAKVGMHRRVFMAYVQTQALLLAPICPHWAEEVLRKVSKQNSTVHTMSFPEMKSRFSAFAASTQLLKNTVSRIKEDVGNKGAQVTFSGSANVNFSRPYSLTILFSNDYTKWQLDCIRRMREPRDEGRVGDELGPTMIGPTADATGLTGGFLKHMQHLLTCGMDPKAVLDKRYPCDQAVVLQAAAEILAHNLPGCMGAKVTEVKSNDDWVDSAKPTPGFPTWFFQNAMPRPSW